MNNEKKVFFTDRSRADQYQRCPTARYLGYHLDGTGVRINRVNFDITIGLCVHEGLGTLLGRYIGLSGQPSEQDLSVCVDLACKIAVDKFTEIIKSTPFDPEEFTPQLEEEIIALPGLILPALNNPASNSPDQYINYTVNETKALIELLIRSYAYAPSGLKWLLDTYEILEVEQEDHFTLYEGSEFDIEFMARADGLLRRRVDNSLVVLSFKTTKTWDSRKQDSAASDMQGMSEVVSIEERMKRWIQGNYFATESPQWYIQATKLGTVNPQIEGVQMIYLLTSESRKDPQSGWKKRSSGLLRPWVMDTGYGEAQFSYKYDWVDGDGKTRRLGKDWRRINVWEEYTIKDYIESIRYDFDTNLNSNPLDLVIITPDLHSRDKDRLERWKKEITAQEYRVAEGLTAIDNAGNTENLNILKSMYFPHHSHSCAYPSRCQFYNICWGTRFESEDPLGSGYKRREPHHLVEKEKLDEQ